MTKFEKEMYKSMPGNGRCFLYLAKIVEFIELGKIMTDEDIAFIEKVYMQMKEERDNE